MDNDRGTRWTSDESDNVVHVVWCGCGGVEGVETAVTLTGVETASEVLGQVSQHLLKTGVSAVSQHLPENRC